MPQQEASGWVNGRGGWVNGGGGGTAGWLYREIVERRLHLAPEPAPAMAPAAVQLGLF